MRVMPATSAFARIHRRLALACAAFLALAPAAAVPAPASPAGAAQPATLPAAGAGPAPVPAVAVQPPVPPAGPHEFSEVWAYLMVGEEQYLDAALPLSDIAYFSAGIGTTGRLGGVPDRGKIAAFPGRVHLVVAELGNFALTHFVLDPELPFRDQLVLDIVRAAAPYDGVQVDFEAVATADIDNYYYFLCLLKQCLGPAKRLGVALPARFSPAQDRLGYERIGGLVDRVVVMAYDEHWSSGEPGPVASLEWCAKVAAYAASRIEPGKLVMGAPFYGRSWADKSLSRSYRYSGVAGLLAEKGIPEVGRAGDIPYVEYGESVLVRLYFDDAFSMSSRLALYRAASVRNVAFWRLGQEDKAVWSAIALMDRPR